MKRILFALFTSIIACSLQAQETKYGVKGGINYATITNVYDKDLTFSIYTSSSVGMRLGYHAGMYAAISFADRFALQPELIYSSKGYQERATYKNSAGLDSEDRITVNLSYVQLPILAKIGITDKFKVMVGPYIEVIARAVQKTKFTVNGETTTEKVTGTGTKYYRMKNVGSGLSFGTGAEFESGLNFGLKYELGLGRVYEVLRSKPVDRKTSHSIFQVYAGFTFGG